MMSNIGTCGWQLIFQLSVILSDIQCMSLMQPGKKCLPQRPSPNLSERGFQTSGASEWPREGLNLMKHYHRS